MSDSQEFPQLGSYQYYPDEKSTDAEKGRLRAIACLKRIIENAVDFPHLTRFEAEQALKALEERT